MKKIISVIMAMALVSCMSVVAFAKESPTATTVTTTKTTTTKNQGNVIKHDYNGGTVSQKTDPNTNEVTYTVNTKDGYKFSGWDIKGDYTIVSGSLDSNTITVIFNSTTKANAKPNFKKVAGGDNGDDNNVSPSTGDNGVYVVLLGAIALGGIVVSKKKLAK